MGHSKDMWAPGNSSLCWTGLSVPLPRPALPMKCHHFSPVTETHRFPTFPLIRSSLLKSTETNSFSLGSLPSGSSVTLLKGKICICCAPSVSKTWLRGDRNMTCFLSGLGSTPWMPSSQEASLLRLSPLPLISVWDTLCLLPHYLQAHILAQMAPPPSRRPSLTAPVNTQ